MKISALVFVLFFGLCGELFAMPAESVRMSVWRKGESIGGEEFIAANEAIVDYLATLERPTGVFETIKYRCQVKSRAIRPSVMGGNSGTGLNQYVWVRTVYELKDCVKE